MRALNYIVSYRVSRTKTQLAENNTDVVSACSNERKVAHQSLCLSSMMSRTLQCSLLKTTLCGVTALVTLAAAELAAAAAWDRMPRVMPPTLDSDGKLGAFDMFSLLRP